MTSAVPTVADAPIGVARSRSFLPEMEALRGVAVLLVFAFHMDAYLRFGAPVEPTLLNSFVHSGHAGVDLFFLLSGFLLALPFIADGLGGRVVSARTFFARRALRILPLYWAAVIVATVMTMESPSDLARGVPYVFFLNAFPFPIEQMFPYSGVWWSLATEVEFYCLLPFLPLALRTRRGRIGGTLALTAYVLAYVAMLRGRLQMSTTASQLTFMFSAFGRGPIFLLGIGAAWLFHVHGDRIRRRLSRSRVLRAGGADLAMVATVVALAFFLRWVDSIGATRQMSAPDQLWHVENGALWTVALLLLLLAPLRAKPLLCNAILSRLGVLSYSIYIVHAPVIDMTLNRARIAFAGLFGWNPRTALFTAVASVACYGVSSLTYRSIERPFLRLKTRFEQAS